MFYGKKPNLKALWIPSYDAFFELPDQTTNTDPNSAEVDDKTAVTITDAAPKTLSAEDTSNLEAKKLNDENNKLKAEIQKLKQENAQLKAEGLRQRSRGGNPTSDAGSQLSSSQAKLQYESQEQAQSPMLYLAVILTIGLLGIFLGKFVV